MQAVASALKDMSGGSIYTTGAAWTSEAGAAAVIYNAIQLAQHVHNEVLKPSRMPIDLSQPLPKDPTKNRMLIEPSPSTPLLLYDADREMIKNLNPDAYMRLPSKEEQILASSEFLVPCLAVPGLTTQSTESLTAYMLDSMDEARRGLIEYVSRRRPFAGPFEEPVQLGGRANDDRTGLRYSPYGVTMDPDYAWAYPFFMQPRR